MARQKILEGADITVIYPTDGTSAIPDATAIVKGAKHMENAKLFLEFTVSSDVQRLVEEAFFRRTVRNDMEEYAAPEQTKLKTIDYDIHWASQEKEKNSEHMGDVTGGEQMKKWIKKSFHRQLLVCFGVVALLPLLLFGVSLIQTMETKINSDYEKKSNRAGGTDRCWHIGIVSGVRDGSGEYKC